MNENIRPGIQQLIVSANYAVLHKAQELQTPPVALRALSETTRAAYAVGGVAAAGGYLAEATECLRIQPADSFELWAALYEDSKQEQPRHMARQAAGFMINSAASHITRHDGVASELASRMLRLIEAGDDALIPFARMIVEDKDMGQEAPHLLSRLYCAGDKSVFGAALATIEEHQEQSQDDTPALRASLFAIAKTAVASRNKSDTLKVLGALEDPIDAVLIEAELLEAGYTYFAYPVLSFMSHRKNDLLNMSLERLLARKGVTVVRQKIRGRALDNLLCPNYDAYSRSDDLRTLHEIGIADASKRLLYIARRASTIEPYLANLQAIGLRKEAQDLAWRHHAAAPSPDTMHFVLQTGPFDKAVWRDLFDYYLEEACDIVAAGQLVCSLAKGKYPQW